MGLMSFIKQAGEKLFNEQAAEQGVQQNSGDGKANVAELNRKAGDAIEVYIKSQNLSATGLTVTFDGATSTATVYGVAPDQQAKEKILLCCGNVQGVAAVNDQMTVEQKAKEPASAFYTVVKGDTLSKIAKQQYGDANKYQAIFEANKPMLKDPDKIYPGQVLRIPQS
jgi:nucleoid-associated protein YgaU